MNLEVYRKSIIEFLQNKETFRTRDFKDFSPDKNIGIEMTKRLDI
jgi:hypothetical protein